jgi:hypothetical protein
MTRVEPVVSSTVKEEFKNCLSEHSRWSSANGWKSTLKNIQLLLIPFLSFSLIKPWLTIFENPLLERCFSTLIMLVDLCGYAFDSSTFSSIHPFSSS